MEAACRLPRLPRHAVKQEGEVGRERGAAGRGPLQSAADTLTLRRFLHALGAIVHLTELVVRVLCVSISRTPDGIQIGCPADRVSSDVAEVLRTGPGPR